jgi:hypothetical protein
MYVIISLFAQYLHCRVVIQFGSLCHSGESPEGISLGPESMPFGLVASWSLSRWKRDWHDMYFLESIVQAVTLPIAGRQTRIINLGGCR